MTKLTRETRLADLIECGRIELSTRMVRAGILVWAGDAELVVTALREKAERDAAPIKAGDDMGNGLVAVPREPSEAMIDKGSRAIRCGVDPRGCDKWDAMMVYRAMINLVNTAKEPESDRVSAMIAAAETGT